MASELDYAAISAHIYQNIRRDENVNPVPNDW
jgi:hypothetical protein